MQWFDSWTEDIQFISTHSLVIPFSWCHHDRRELVHKKPGATAAKKSKNGWNGATLCAVDVQVDRERI